MVTAMQSTTGNDGTGGSPEKQGPEKNGDNQRQVIDQKITNFLDANGRDATNIIDETALGAKGQYFEVRAAARRRCKYGT